MRSSTVETMAAIVRDEPPAIEEKLPVPLRWIIDRCLQKEPEHRYDSTRDLFLELKHLREHLGDAYASDTFASMATPRKTRYFRLTAWVGCVAFAGLLAYLFKPAGPNVGNYRYIRLARNIALGGGVWSSDGKAVAYPVTVNGVDQVFLRYLDSPNPIQLTHEKRNLRPLGWSSDRSHVIVIEYFDNKESPHHQLYSVPTVGGELEFIGTPIAKHATSPAMARCLQRWSMERITLTKLKCPILLARQRDFICPRHSRLKGPPFSTYASVRMEVRSYF